MRSSFRFLAIAVLGGLSNAALAAGYDVSWGLLGVPISPWVEVAIGLMILASAYAFMKRYAGRGLMTLFAALLVGALSLHADKNADAFIPGYGITTGSGSYSYTCASEPSWRITNNTSQYIVLTVVLTNPPPPTQPSDCHTGTVLAPSGGSEDYCDLTCPGSLG